MMNERIRELALQAGAQGIVNRDFIDVEKFAELIVRECAGVGQQYADGNYEVYNQILEHFGLEEE